MLQFNLLPEVKIQFIKARKAKRTVLVVAVLLVAVSVSLLVVLITITVAQKHHISSLDASIKADEKTLQDTPDLAKILTIQNQLNSLPALYAQRPVASRLFGYVQATTPVKVSITHLSLDFSASTLKVDGTADSLESINRYVDTLKFTTYSVKGTDGKIKPFSNVVLTTFSRDSKTAAFSIGLKFDAVIFDASKEVTLDVPKTVTTRSETELPSSGVFDAKGTN